MDNFLTGIPLYDSGSNVLYNERLTIPSDTYIANFGFGVGYGTINADLAGETVSAYARYFHQYETNDPSSYNYLNSQDSVTADMYDMFALGYYGTKLNDTSDNYEWFNQLATERPIALNADSNGLATKWRVKLHYDDSSYVYNTLSSVSDLAAFKGTQIHLEDYLTPFKLALNNKWARSTDFASSSSGFAGVQAYIDGLDEGKSDWSNVGIQINETEGALDFTFVTPKTAFYAMYDLSSSLYSPIPEAFVTALGGASYYGIYDDTGVGGTGFTGVDSVLSVGAYVPEKVESGSQIIFKKNSTSPVSSLFHFDGYKYWIWEGAATDATYAYQRYYEGKLDSVSIPSAYIQTETSNPDRRVTKGDTVWKLQTNACTQTQWDAYFGENGSIAQGSTWEVKPIMSNKNFLNGVYYAIDRPNLAKKLGRNAAQGFLSDSYMSDPENAIAYRNSDAGKAVLADRSPETLGYDTTKATTLFQTAVAQEVASGGLTAGTAASPTTITLQLMYQTASQVSDEGVTVKGYIEGVFDSAFPDGDYKLVLNTYAGAVWSDVYYKACMLGQFDFAFGSISGNTLDPLSFMEVIKSNNTSGFTLSWGADTNAVSSTIVYDNKYWSYDSLWAAGNAGAIVIDGVNSPAFSAEASEFDIPVADLTATNTAEVQLDYYVSDLVQITIDEATWYNPSDGTETVIPTDNIADDDNGTITITYDVAASLTEASTSYSYGYVIVYYSQTVSGITTEGLEIDIAVVFYVA
jgi:hypothetical protein